MSDTPVFTETDLDTQSINTIRFLAVDAVEKAQSGHPGMPMGAAPMAYVLWKNHLRHNPSDPSWFDRDRFILSAGHGSMLLYGLLHLSGYDLPIEEIEQFRQWGSKTPGHPEVTHTPGVEMTTGPLGQGFATGVGMALAERHLAARYNTETASVVDHYTYGIVSDGDLMEGVSHEAASLAGHLGLGKLIYLYDDNHISIDGKTDLSFSEDVEARFASYGWHTVGVDDGNDLEAIDRAIREAQAETDRPSLIRVRTHIGFGAPNQQDTSAAHGSPLGDEETRLAKENLGWPVEPTFHVPEGVSAHMDATERGVAQQEEWKQVVDTLRTSDPERADAFEAAISGSLEVDWDEVLPQFEAGEGMATRASSGKVLNALVPAIPTLVGGSADLTGSNKTKADGQEPIHRDDYSGRYVYYGVREHAMAAACNGMALHGGIHPYGGTFLIFSDYLRPSLRLAALMETGVTQVLTHDSIGLGEDGPTHQPIEHLMALRAIPNCAVVRPGDANEVAQAWRIALERDGGPTVLALTRQGVPTLDRSKYAAAEGALRGAYVLYESDAEAELLFVASGSELALALEAAEQIEASGVGVRVVSMPCWELFEQQDEEYKRSVFPPELTRRVAVEAGLAMGWERYVGPEGAIVGLDHFGASAPGEIVMEKFGFTTENVVRVARELL